MRRQWLLLLLISNTHIILVLITFRDGDKSLDACTKGIWFYGLTIGELRGRLVDEDITRISA